MGCCLQTPDKRSMPKFSLKVKNKALYSDIFIKHSDYKNTDNVDSRSR